MLATSIVFTGCCENDIEKLKLPAVIVSKKEGDNNYWSSVMVKSLADSNAIVFTTKSYKGRILYYNYNVGDTVK